MSSIQEALNTMLTTVGSNIFCQCPCKVTNVNGNFVDVLMIYNDEEPDFVIYNVPIKREETKNAYIFLGIKAGDYGTLRFYDRSIENFTQGSLEYNGDDRQHDINDRCFELGFIPSPEAFVYPTNADIEIGLKDGSEKITINTIDGTIMSGATIKIKSDTKITLDAPETEVTGNLTIKTGASGTFPCGISTLSFSDGVFTGDA